MKRLLIVVAGLIAYASPAASPQLAVTQGDEARPVGACLATQVCAFNDPEDLADLTGTPWLIVSEAATNGSSGLAAYDTRSGTIIHFVATDLGPSCALGSRGGGIGLRRDGDSYRLVRILHSGAGGGDAVESFRVGIIGGRPALNRIGCVSAPSPYFLNDITPLPDGGFAATHMFDRSVPRDQREKAFLGGSPTGYVVRWSPTTGWTRIPDTAGVFPNGIDASADGQWLVFAESYGHAINRIRLDGSGRVRVPLAMQPDNVTALDNTRFIVVGGTGRPLVSTRRCPELRRPGCGFPAVAAEIDFASSTVRTIAVGGGGSTPGFSVGVVKGQKLYLGTAFGDRITILAVGSGVANTP